MDPAADQAVPGELNLDTNLEIVAENTGSPDPDDTAATSTNQVVNDASATATATEEPSKNTNIADANKPAEEITNMADANKPAEEQPLEAGESKKMKLKYAFTRSLTETGLPGAISFDAALREATSPPSTPQQANNATTVDKDFVMIPESGLPLHKSSASTVRYSFCRKAIAMKQSFLVPVLLSCWRLGQGSCML